MSDSDEVTIELTTTQTDALAAVFGSEFSTRVRGIKVENVDGEYRAAVLKN